MSGSPVEKNKNLVGLRGWLAFFMVAVGVGMFVNIASLVSYPAIFNDFTAAAADNAAYIQAMTPLLWFEVFMHVALIGMAIWLAVALGQRKKVAKNIAITFLASSVVLGFFDYIWAASVFDAFDLTQYVESEMNGAAGDVLRSVVSAAIWIPYFVVSKRVKLTLTR